MNSANLKAAVIVALHHVGTQTTVFNDEQTEVLILALETEKRTHFLKCDMPVSEGGAIHLLAQVTSGFSLNHRDVKPGDILGKPVLVELVASESFSALRSCQPFPCAPKFSAPGIKYVSSDARLTGQRNGVAVVVGGSRPVSAPTFPAPPAPRSKLTSWSVSDLREPKLPQGLPAIIAQMTMRSSQWRDLEAETPAPTKRK